MIRYLRAVMPGLEPGIHALLADEAPGINKTNRGIIDKRPSSPGSPPWTQQSVCTFRRADAADWREVKAPPSRARATNEIKTGMMSCTARMLADMLCLRSGQQMAVR